MSSLHRKCCLISEVGMYVVISVFCCDLCHQCLKSSLFFCLCEILHFCRFFEFFFKNPRREENLEKSPNFYAWLKSVTKDIRIFSFHIWIIVKIWLKSAYGWLPCWSHHKIEKKKFTVIIIRKKITYDLNEITR